MKVLVIGGYGAFGARIVRRLRHIPGLEVLTGGRNPSRADVVLDVMQGGSLTELFADLKPHLVIHTAGPFDETEGYAVARACLAASSAGHKCNYLDLADDRDYVMGFGVLDEEARRQGCLLVTGASTTPAVTTSVISHHCPSFFASYPPPRAPWRNGFSRTAPLSHFDTLSCIDINLSVANSSMPGEGTVKSVLSYCGESIKSIQSGTETEVFGWKTLTAKQFPGMTHQRWCSDVSVPDVDIFTSHLNQTFRPPHAFPKVITPTQKRLSEFCFRAGVESRISMLGLSLFSTLRAHGLVSSSLSLTDFSTPLLQLNKALNLFSTGKGQGGMTVDMMGTTAPPSSFAAAADKIDKPRKSMHVRWGLSANEDTGPEIPCTPAVIVTSQLHYLYKYRNAHVSASQVVVQQYLPGARECADMISLEDFTDAIQRDALDIQQYIMYGDSNCSCSSSSRRGEKCKADSCAGGSTNACITTPWSRYSPTFIALDHLSQQQLPDPICAVHALGGVVTGDLLVSMSRFPIVRLSSLLLGLPMPGWITKQQAFKFLVNMENQKWRRFSTCADTSPGYCHGQGRASSVNVFSSSFATCHEDQLLTESLAGGLLQFSMQQKAMTRVRQKPARPALGERPWLYEGFEGVCVRASLLGGLLPLPTWLAPSPHCVTTPHKDGMGWDLLVTLSLPLLGEVVRYEGPLRIAHTHQDAMILTPAANMNRGEADCGEGNRSLLDLQATIQSVYGVQATTATAALFQRILGKYLLIYDSKCVICDASVARLIEKDQDNLLMFSSMHDSKSQQLLSELGLSVASFHEKKDETIFVITPLGTVLTHSEAMLALLKILPGVDCAVLHSVLRVMPRIGRDGAYRYLARNRHSLLGGNRGAEQIGGDVCTLLPARTQADQARFL